MATYTFSAGTDTALLAPGDNAIVNDLAFFNPTDNVTGAANATLIFGINGDLVLSLTGYGGITGFSLVRLTATGSLDLTIGQDFYDANAAAGTLTVQGNGGRGEALTLGAGGLDADSSVTLVSFEGNDVLTGGAGGDQLIGGAGDDVTQGGAGGDRLIGGDGFDVLAGGAGADQLDGGTGVDTADYSASSSAVIVDLSLGTGVGGDAQGDTLVSIEQAIGSALNDKLTGDGLGNILLGLAGNDGLIGGGGPDGLYGGDGDDALHGGAGADALNGDAGIDQADYRGSATAVTIDLQAVTATGGDAQGDALTGIENLFGSSFDDQLSGDDGRTIFGGGNGADTLIGRGGDDSLAGEAGNDSLDGGAGNDRLIGSAGVDTIHGGIGNDSVDAGSENDQVFGEAGNDNLVGGAGNDRLEGGDGNDVLDGGVGADTLIGGAGIDTISYTASATGVTVSLATGTTEGDSFSGIEQVLGSASADTLTGDALANTLWGLAGNDVLTGGGGADLLKGGPGNDSFVYTALSDSTVAGAGKDVIADFSTGDRIDLSAIDADGNAANGDTAFSFGTGGFTGHAGELRVVTAGAIQVVYVDANGDKAPDMAINVIANHPLTAGDFVL